MRSSGFDADNDGVPRSRSEVARLVLVEGLPGSGKTSVAKHLSRALRSRGIAAVGIRELDPDHPVVPRSVMRLAGGDDYAKRCLERWEAFVDAAPEGVAIIEGCALQSTVRFLFANGASGDEICAYWERFEKLIAPLSPRFVYLYQDDPAGFMESRTLVRRGSEWTEKVAGYAVGTARGRERGWEGAGGMVAFWMEYRAICDALYERSSTCKLAVENSEQFWSSLHTRILDWVMDPAPPPGPGPASSSESASGRGVAPTPGIQPPEGSLTPRG